MLAKLGTDPCKQDGKLERFRDVVIRARIQTQNGVGIRIMPRQHQDRAFDSGLAHAAAKFAPIGVGQAHVKDHDIIGSGLGLLHPLDTIGGLEDVEVLGHHQLLGQRLAQVVVVVHKQDLAKLCHGSAPFVDGQRLSRPLGDRCGAMTDPARFATGFSRGRVSMPGNVSIP